MLISEIALHAVNLQHFPEASVLIIEDEDSAGELFARIRVNYSVQAKHIEPDGKHWVEGIARLADRHGERINHLSQLADFKLFRLVPQGGRYVKGFGRAFSLAGKPSPVKQWITSGMVTRKGTWPDISINRRGGESLWSHNSCVYITENFCRPIPVRQGVTGSGVCRKGRSL